MVFLQAYTEVLSLCRKETTLPESFNATESDLKKLKQEIIGKKSSVKCLGSDCTR